MPAAWDPTDDTRLEQMPAHALLGARRNPKQHDDSGIQGSLLEFGYVTPVLLDERTGRLVAGHGRVANVLALESAGRPKDYPAGKPWPPQGITVDEHGRWCLPVIRGWSSNSDLEGEAYLVGSNALTEMGGWYEGAMRDHLRFIEQNRPELLARTGIPQDELAAILSPGDLDDDIDPPDLDEDVYREQYGLIIRTPTFDEAEHLALILREEHGFTAARAIQA